RFHQIKDCETRIIGKIVLHRNNIGMLSIDRPAECTVPVQASGSVNDFLFSVPVDIGNFNLMPAAPISGSKTIESTQVVELGVEGRNYFILIDARLGNDSGVYPIQIAYRHLNACRRS